MSQGQFVIGAGIALGIFLGILLSLHVGQKLGHRYLERDRDRPREGLSIVEGTIFTLMGLLIAFSFSGAQTRFDTRRQLIATETNAIGTAYLRLELLPAAAQASLKERFGKYLDARISAYRTLPDIDGSRQYFDEATRLQGEIWGQAVAACKVENNPAVSTLVLSALNEMIDITTVRAVALKAHPPTVIFVMLIMVSLAAALMVGYRMASSTSRSWVHVVAFALVIASTLYVIIDFEYPRAGIIRIESVDQALLELRNRIR
jgi:hypothetical protein